MGGDNKHCISAGKGRELLIVRRDSGKLWWGEGHDVKTAIWWGLADRLPWDQIQLRMAVDFRQMMVLVGDKRRLQRLRDSSTHPQLERRVLGVPRQRSSASLVKGPSWIRSPRMQHIISSGVFSEPGIPIADLV